MPTAKERYDALGAAEEANPLERLRAFCSLAMTGQDWLDVEPFFDDLAAAMIDRAPPLVYEPPQPLVWDEELKEPQTKPQMLLAEQVADALREVYSWSEERRRNVHLEGGG